MENIIISDEEKWKLIKSKVWAIEDIKEPTEEMCIYCVRNAWNTLKLIKNPSEKIILEAIKANGWAIQFVENPTEEQKLLAVSNAYDAIKYIDHPSPNVQLAAVKNDYHAVKYIENPAFEVKVAAIKQDPSAITSFSYTEDEFYILLHHSLMILKYISAYNKELVLDIIKSEISKEEVPADYIYEFINLQALKIDKIDFVYKFGSDNAKKYYVDYNL